MMNTRQPWILFAAFAGLGLLLAAALFLGNRAGGQLVTINNTTVPPAPALDSARVAQGAALYAQYCAECHGANLEGAVDWKQRQPDGSLPPPPHDGGERLRRSLKRSAQRFAGIIRMNSC